MKVKLDKRSAVIVLLIGTYAILKIETHASREYLESIFLLGPEVRLILAQVLP